MIDKDSINDLPSYTSQFSTSHLYPENQIPGKNIPANPVTVEKKLKKAVTPALKNNNKVIIFKFKHKNYLYNFTFNWDKTN